MAELIVSIILTISLGGTFFIVRRKIPALLELFSIPTAAPIENFWRRIFKKAVTAGQKLPFFKNFHWQSWLEKRLSKLRVLALKTDNKITGYIQLLRIKEAEKSGKILTGSQPGNEYWSDIKKFVKTRAGLRIKPITNPQAEPSVKAEDAISQIKAVTGVDTFVARKINISQQDILPSRKKKRKKTFSKKNAIIW